MEKFDQLLPTLVPKKHRRKIYRGKAPFKKWLVTWADITFLDGHIPLPFIVARCHATQCFNRPFTIKGGKKKATKWNFIAQVGPLLSSNAQFLRRSYENVISPKRVGGRGKTFAGWRGL